MITKLNLGNFKCFKSAKINIAPLTVLAGINSMGKSTVIESILLLRQSWLKEPNMNTFRLFLNNQYLRLGTGADIVCDYSELDIITIEILDNKKNLVGQWSSNRFKPSSVLQRIPLGAFGGKNHIDDSQNFSSNIFSYNDGKYIDFSYISADRLGPRSRFEIPDESTEINHEIGCKGEYAAYYLASMMNKNIPLREMAKENEPNTIGWQVNKWMSYISPGFKVHTLVQRDMDAVQLSYSADEGAKDRRSANVGFGLTYTLPIVIALLTVNKGGILLLENPEAHLHPKAQTMIGTLIALAVENGAQVILETHSDHIINGIRVAIKEGRMTADKLLIDFFSKSDATDDSTPCITEIYADKNGKLNDWPKDFLSEWEDNLFKLL